MEVTSHKNPCTGQLGKHAFIESRKNICKLFLYISVSERKKISFYTGSTEKRRKELRVDDEGDVTISRQKSNLEVAKNREWARGTHAYNRTPFALRFSNWKQLKVEIENCPSTL